MLIRPFAAVSAAAVTLALGGCLISSSNSTYESGRRVSPSTTSRIELGSTTESWLIATLGEPTSRSDVHGQPGVQILRYDYSRREESGGALFLIFAGSSSKSTSNSTWFEVTNGVVTNYGHD